MSQNLTMPVSDPLILAGTVPVSGSLVVWVRLSND
jgi:hypothetical protein